LYNGKVPCISKILHAGTIIDVNKEPLFLRVYTSPNL